MTRELSIVYLVSGKYVVKAEGLGYFTGGVVWARLKGQGTAYDTLAEAEEAVVALRGQPANRSLDPRQSIIEVRDQHGVGVAGIRVGGSMITIGSNGKDQYLTPETVAKLRDALDEALLLVGYRGSVGPSRGGSAPAGSSPAGSTIPTPAEADKNIRTTIGKETAVIRTLCAELLMQTWQGALDIEEIALKARGIVEAADTIERTVLPWKKEWTEDDKPWGV